MFKGRIKGCRTAKGQHKIVRGKTKMRERKDDGEK